MYTDVVYRRCIQTLYTEPQNIHQIRATLSSVARVMNSRPLGLSSQQEGEFRPITPGDLLVNRIARSSTEVDNRLEIYNEQQEAEYINEVSKAKMAVFAAWKNKWLAAVFPLLVVRSKWKKKTENLAVGQIGMLKYKTKYGADSFKLARVSQVFQDDNKVVRTVEVEVGLYKGHITETKHRLNIPSNSFCPMESVRSELFINKTATTEN